MKEFVKEQRQTYLDQVHLGASYIVNHTYYNQIPLTSFINNTDQLV